MIVNTKQAIEIKARVYQYLGKPPPAWLHTLELRLGDDGYRLVAIVSDLIAAKVLPTEFDGLPIVSEKRRA